MLALVWHNKSSLIHINHKFSVSAGFYSKRAKTHCHLSLPNETEDDSGNHVGCITKWLLTAYVVKFEKKNTQTLFYTAMAHTSRRPIPPGSPLRKLEAPIWSRLNFILIPQSISYINCDHSKVIWIAQSKSCPFLAHIRIFQRNLILPKLPPPTLVKVLFAWVLFGISTTNSIITSAVYAWNILQT